MLKDLEAWMNDKTGGVFVSMQRDYRAVIGGAPQGHILPKSERLTRQAVSRIVDGVEALFCRIAAGDPLECDNDNGQTLENDGSRLNGLGKDALVTSEPRVVESSSGKNDFAEAANKPSPSIKTERKDQAVMADGREPIVDTSVEAPVLSVEAIDQPASSRKRQFTPDALNAQFSLPSAVGQSSEPSENSD